VFATSIHFHPNSMFVGKVVSLLLACNQIRGSTLVGSSLAHKYQIREEVNGSSNTLAYYDKSTIMTINTKQVYSQVYSIWSLKKFRTEF
jgi:hypothetical protein